MKSQADIVIVGAEIMGLSIAYNLARNHSVTNVVVHERGVPRFVRILITGGNEITDAIASELHIDPDTAEDLKRRADASSTDELEVRAARITTDRLSPFVEEVRGSIDYYRAQAADGGEISRVLLTGGGSQVPGLPDP